MWLNPCCSSHASRELFKKHCLTKTYVTDFKPIVAMLSKALNKLLSVIYTSYTMVNSQVVVPGLSLYIPLYLVVKGLYVALVSIHKEKEENGSYAGTNINISGDSYITLC